MPRISEMTHNSYLMYKMAQKNGVSMFGSGAADKSSSSYKSSDANPIGNLYSSTASTLSGLSDINTNRRELVSSYDSAAKTFKAEFGSAMKDLKGSIAEMKKLDFNIGPDAITTKSATAEDGTVSTSTEYSKELQEVLDSIKGFADDYNAATSLFKDYSDVSKKMKLMANVFGDTTARASTYAKIGLNVGSDGKISIDEEKLAKAITETPSRVKAMLGKDGLAGKAESHVQFAQGQSERLFPSINTMFGSQLKKANVYTGSAMLRMSGYSNLGNLVSMMF